MWDKINWAAHGMPPEIGAMIKDELGGWPIRRRDAERLWRDCRQEYQAVQRRTFGHMDSYSLGEWATEGYDWPNRFPGEPEPPLSDDGDGPDGGDGPNDDVMDGDLSDDEADTEVDAEVLEDVAE